MNGLKKVVFFCLLLTLPCRCLQPNQNSSQVKDTSIVIASSIAIFSVASFLQWYFSEPNQNQDSALEPILCYAGEWGKMLCNSFATAYGGRMYVCYKN